MITVPAIYDGKNVKLSKSPVDKPYRVLVTFVEPIAPAPDLNRFWASFGAWQDDRSTEEILNALRETRLSRAEPPAL